MKGVVYGVGCALSKYLSGQDHATRDGNDAESRRCAGERVAL